MTDKKPSFLEQFVDRLRKPGYHPPKTVKELLKRYQQGERSFPNVQLQRADLPGANLKGIDLSGSDLKNANLHQARLQQSNLIGAELQGATLVGANCEKTNFQDAKLYSVDFSAAKLEGVLFTGADLRGANLRGTNLRGINLEGVTLRATNLRGVNLSEATGTPADRKLSELNLSTYQKSGWAPEQLVEWRRAGALILNLDEFPLDVRQAILDTQEGLTLFFDTRLIAFDRFLVDSVIFGVLGAETECQIEKFENREGSAIVHLQSSKRDDLIRVAEALYQRLWQPQPKSQEASQPPKQGQSTQLATSQFLATAWVPLLNDLRDNKLARAELREKTKDKTAPETIEKWYFKQPLISIQIQGDYIAGDKVSQDKIETTISGQAAVLAIGEGAQATLQGSTNLVQDGNQVLHEDDQNKEPSGTL